TGSCPCQPFSPAGKGDGFADERHLWPQFFHLISERRPQHVFGEQVAAGNANVWFDLVQADLEGMGYAFGLVPFTSA
ncbi:DNA cytosine methyltransferase, partial [Mycobacterium tuberculosis]|nr:DNA cytosine methyltransferase [Mycobacterium tuberculosis]